MKKFQIPEWIDVDFRSCIYRDSIDLEDFDNIVSWCRCYANSCPSNDTRDPLVRWNIGTYQLLYVYLLKEKKEVAMIYDISESIASAMLHMIMAFESISTEYMNYKLLIEKSKNDSLSRQQYLELYVWVLGCTRQFLYHHMGRKKRFNYKELKKYYEKVMLGCFTLFPIQVSIAEGFDLAMQKLYNVELKGH